MGEPWKTGSRGGFPFLFSLHVPPPFSLASSSGQGWVAGAPTREALGLGALVWKCSDFRLPHPPPFPPSPAPPLAATHVAGGPSSVTAARALRQSSTPAVLSLTRRACPRAPGWGNPYEARDLPLSQGGADAGGLGSLLWEPLAQSLAGHCSASLTGERVTNAGSRAPSPDPQVIGVHSTAVTPGTVQRAPPPPRQPTIHSPACKEGVEGKLFTGLRVSARLFQDGRTANSNARLPPSLAYGALPLSTSPSTALDRLPHSVPGGWGVPLGRLTGLPTPLPPHSWGLNTGHLGGFNPHKHCLRLVRTRHLAPGLNPGPATN